MVDDSPSVPLPAIRFISKYPSCVLFPFPFIQSIQSHIQPHIARRPSPNSTLLEPRPRSQWEKAVDNPSPLEPNLTAAVFSSVVSGPFAQILGGSTSAFGVVKLPMSLTLTTGRLIIERLKPNRERFTTLFILCFYCTCIS
ncbi:hypothetical protein F5Y04DRAFT_9750 [Hypomontagnella monticulosa]|nr:hypothetical protein F5Y04DRAFT_9750 [Hypomontagnella monticulosa]